MREREGEDRGEEETLKGPTERRGGGKSGDVGGTGC